MYILYLTLEIQEEGYKLDGISVSILISELDFNVIDRTMFLVLQSTH